MNARMSADDDAVSRLPARGKLVRRHFPSSSRFIGNNGRVHALPPVESIPKILPETLITVRLVDSGVSCAE
jgi:hypothetical protein